MRLDTNSNFPSGMEEYLSVYGWHFSKKMCEFAVNRMKKKNEEENTHKISKEEVDNILKRNSIILKNDIAYDKVYIANMCMSDFYGSSVIDENRLAKYIKDTLDDEDGYPEIAFTRFYADCIGKGVVIIWEDVI